MIGAIRVSEAKPTFQRHEKVEARNEALKGMSRRHGDLFLTLIGTYLKRLSEGGSFHHTGVTCFHAVVDPHP